MTIQWYPGHIAKAERQLQEQLKLVDVVLEVRDARIPLATHHPKVPQWVGSKGRLLVINRVDMVPQQVRDLWQQWFEAREERAYFTNARDGAGVASLAKAAQKFGEEVNRRRQSRGMLPRPVRAVAIGFPNVGKSALINRLLKRKVAQSARRPGVTRQLHWIRISDQMELLDAPGVIPNLLKDQTNALKLAICDDIGEAAYQNHQVAEGLVELLKGVNDRLSNQPTEALTARYSIDPTPHTGEAYLHTLAEVRYQGDTERAARSLLNDFRTGLLGKLALELPP